MRALNSRILVCSADPDPEPQWNGRASAYNGASHLVVTLFHVAE